MRKISPILLEKTNSNYCYSGNQCSKKAQMYSKILGYWSVIQPTAVPPKQSSLLTSSISSSPQPSPPTSLKEILKIRKTDKNSYCPLYKLPWPSRKKIKIYFHYSVSTCKIRKLLPVPWGQKVPGMYQIVNLNTANYSIFSKYLNSNISSFYMGNKYCLGIQSALSWKPQKSRHFL